MMANLSIINKINIYMNKHRYRYRYKYRYKLNAFVGFVIYRWSSQALLNSYAYLCAD